MKSRKKLHGIHNNEFYTLREVVQRWEIDDLTAELMACGLVDLIFGRGATPPPELSELKAFGRAIIVIYNAACEFRRRLPHLCAASPDHVLIPSAMAIVKGARFRRFYRSEP